MAQSASNNPTIAPNQQQGVYRPKSSAPFGQGESALPSPDLLKLDQEVPAPKQPSAAPEQKPAWLATVPFGRSSSQPSAAPSPASPAAQAVPVQGVDAIEVTEPAAPSVVPLEADPVTEDPAEPTEETAPIFSTTFALKPRHIVFRALNKVTGRASVVEVAPGEAVRFGKLSITALTCQISEPNSQRDDAGFFEINEVAENKSVFRGWMYASSPSITSPEHPIYDVTMVECVTDDATRSAEKKQSAPADAIDADATESLILD